MLLVIGRRIGLALMALAMVGVISSDVNGQKRRTKRSRRVTNPVTTAAQAPTPAATTTSDPKIISTADESAYDSPAPTARSTRSRRNRAYNSSDATQDKVDRLSAQVNALNEKLSLMEQQQRTLVDLERLSRAETRGETLRAQLRDVQAKEGELQTRALQLEYELQPSVIERTLASSGSTRPEDLREQRRRQLEAEKNIVQTQTTQLGMSRARLETAIANADTEADRLRARIDSALESAPIDTSVTDAGSAPPPTDQESDIGLGRP